MIIRPIEGDLNSLLPTRDYKIVFRNRLFILVIGMNKWLLFCGGIVTGIVITFLFAFLFSSSSGSNNGITWFEKPGDVIEVKSFKVFQVLDILIATRRKDEKMYLLPDKTARPVKELFNSRMVCTRRKYSPFPL